MLRKAGSFAETMSFLSGELASRPNDPLVYYHIAWTHDRLGLERDAAPAYETALALGLDGEELKSCFLGLGSTYRTMGDYENSKRIFEIAIRSYPGYRAFKPFYAMTLFNLGHQAEVS